MFSAEMTAEVISPIPMCDGSGVLNNPSYYAFVADGSDIFNVTVTPEIGSCSDAGGFVGIQGALVTLGACNTNSPFGTCMTNCTNGPFTLSSNTIPDSGQVVIVVLDGCNGSYCNVDIHINSGWTNNYTVPDTSQISESILELESNVNCRNYTFSVQPEFEGLCNYLWTLPDGSTRTTDSNSLEMDMNGIPDGSICVQGFSEVCFPDQFFPADNSICYTFSASEFTTITTGSGTTTCGLANGSAYVEVDGEGPFTYIWNNGIADSLNTNIEGGLYTVTVIDGFGCEYVEMISVAESEELVVELIDIIPSSPIENTGSVRLKLNTSDEWAIKLEGPLGFIFNDTIVGSNIKIYDLSPGAYLLTITDIDSECSKLIQFEIQIISSNRENQSNRNKTIKLFPNPVKNVVNVEMENVGNEYTIFSLDGKVVQNGIMISKQVLIENLAHGVYILQIADTSGKLHHAKIMKVN